MSPLSRDPWSLFVNDLEEPCLLILADATIRHANAAFLATANLTAHHVLGRNLTEIASALPLRRALREALAGHTGQSHEIQLTTRLGEVRHLTLRLAHVPGDEPLFLAFLRPKEPREINQRLLTSIIEDSEDAIVTKTLEGQITSWNPAAERLFGYTVDQAIGRPITMLIPTECLSEEAEIIARIRRGEKLRHYQARRLARDGSILDLSISVSPIRDAEGRIIGASKIARDIRMEKARRERLAVLASVYENCREAIMLLNAKGEFVEVNAGFSEMTGFAPEEVIGRSFDVFRSGRQSPRVARAMLAELRRTLRCTGEVWTRRKDGTPLAGLLTVTALPRAAENSRFIAILADITTLRQNEERLEKLAHHDALTGLPNRLLMHERLERALLHAEAASGEVCVAYLDIDGFKAVNDRFGHDSGDEILVNLGQRIQDCLGPEDTLARIGGDEFVLILPGPAGRRETLDQVAERIAQPIRLFGAEVAISASIGVATYPQDRGLADQLIRLADQAMFEVKKEGGRAIRHFDSARQRREQDLRHLVAEVETALAEGQMELHLQPKVNLVTGAILGAEVLLRWMHPIEGLRLPGRYLGQLTEHPVIEEIGAFVATEAMRHILALRTAGLAVPLSMNVAARELRRANYAGFLVQQAQMIGLDRPDLLQLELLENAALDSDPQILRTLDACRAHGFRLAIDDFGVGFASLSTLGRIPADTIKLDRSFVTDIASDEGAAKIAAAVVAMAAAFGKQVVAEGVETRAAARRLVSLGCEVAQGFAITPALPRKAFIAWAQQWQKGQDRPVLEGPLLRDWAEV